MVAQQKKGKITLGSGLAAAGIAIGIVGLVFLFFDLHMLPKEHRELMWILRGIITGVWLIGGVIVLILDKWGKCFKSVDKKTFDVWTALHFGWGIVFGIWYFPLIQTMVITILWEVFERFASGFGEDETFWNYFVDVVAAWIGWFIVVGSVMIAMKAMGEKVFFPLIVPSKFFWQKTGT